MHLHPPTLQTSGLLYTYRTEVKKYKREDSLKGKGREEGKNDGDVPLTGLVAKGNRDQMQMISGSD